MAADDVVNGAAENQQFLIDADRCAVLRCANFLLNRFDDIQVFVGVYQHFYFSYTVQQFFVIKCLYFNGASGQLL